MAAENKIKDRIKEYERLGLFDRDVEDDPETIPLKPGKVDYTCKKLSTRISAKIANKIGSSHFEKMLKKGDVMIKEIRGRENLSAIESCGALITCNHFNPFDNYAVYKAILPILGKRDLYKVIREGNYTNFKGLYGYLFRHCNTLPLSSSLSCMKEFLSALNLLFARGEKVLIYPEQGMWTNYKKPRPLKVGSFRLAVKENVPVLPVFITFEEVYDTKKAKAAFAYTIHILPAIFPDPHKKIRENSESICRENYRLWKQVYEEFYNTPLTYTTEGEFDICSFT